MCCASVSFLLCSRTITEDGYETTFAVNHLAHFLLTDLLLPDMQGSTDGRIVVLTSSLHKSVPEFDFEDVQVSDTSKESVHVYSISYRARRALWF